MINTAKIIKPGMRVAVMGFGVTGRSAVEYCLGCGAEVLVSDSGSRDKLEYDYGEYFRERRISVEAGGHSWEFLKDAELVIVSPGIPLESSVVIRLKENGIPVVGELAVAAPCLDSPVAAITGTNGKTTVTSLLGHILEEAGRKVFIGGNIGTPLFDYIREKKRCDFLVLEVSSFQLELAGLFRPDIAILLNISPDHLDRHGDLAGYTRAKVNLFARQEAVDCAIVYADDPNCKAVLPELKSEVRTFGGDVSADAVIDGLKIRIGIEPDEQVYDIEGTDLATVTGARNCAAAILAAHHWKIGPDDIRNALQSFTLKPHRMQKVGEYGGITFINDSKATNTGAVLAALEQFENGVILIAGGRHKGEEYKALREQVSTKVKTLILLGEAKDRIAAALEGCCPIRNAESLEEAVHIGVQLARPGDTVLLSPACSSFDMFSSYGHRGQVFTDTVKNVIQSGTSEPQIQHG